MNTIEKMRLLVAELLGTMLLVIIGCGSIAQFKLNSGSFSDVGIGFGLGAAVGILVSMPVSGGHINPAVTGKNFNN